MMKEFQKPIYTAKVHATGGREAESRSSDGRLAVKHSLVGAPGDGTNPEQLFAAGWSACFASAIALAAQQRKVALPKDVAVDAEIGLLHVDGAYSLQARLDVALPRPRQGRRADAGRRRARHLPLLQGHARQHRRGSPSRLNSPSSGAHTRRLARRVEVLYRR